MAYGLDTQRQEHRRPQLQVSAVQDSPWSLCAHSHGQRAQRPKRSLLERRQLHLEQLRAREGDLETARGNRGFMSVSGERVKSKEVLRTQARMPMLRFGT